MSYILSYSFGNRTKDVEVIEADHYTGSGVISAQACGWVFEGGRVSSAAVLLCLNKVKILHGKSFGRTLSWIQAKLPLKHLARISVFRNVLSPKITVKRYSFV